MSKATDLSHLNDLTDLEGITDGTNGQVLTTDGSGTFTFEDAAGGVSDFASLTGKPTTISGYGITDALEIGTTATTALAGNTSLFSGAYADLTGKPTLLTLGTTSTTALAGDTSLFSGAYADLTGTPTLPTDFVSAASGGTFSGNVAMTGDLTVDTDTLYVDSTNNNVGIGTTSPARELSIGDGTGSPNIQLLASNTGNSRLEFGDTDDSDVGEIQYLHGDNAMLFHVNAAERMRIDTTGNVLVAKNNTTVGDVGSMLKSNGQIFSTTNGADSFHNYDTSQNRYEFYVKGNGGIANYSSNNVNLSDQTEKKNIAAAASVWDDVKGFALKEFHYNFEDDADPKQLGVIAQEVQVNHPDLIKSFKIDDSTTKLGVIEQQITWMAIKALQEAMTKIEILETKVTALEASN